jgi:hypothetical protein
MGYQSVGKVFRAEVYWEKVSNPVLIMKLKSCIVSLSINCKLLIELYLGLILTTIMRSCTNVRGMEIKFFVSRGDHPASPF